VKEIGLRNRAHGVEKFGLKDLAAVHWNLPDTALVEHAIANGEGFLVEGGAFCAETGVHTGRSPKDKSHRDVGVVVKTRPAFRREISAAV
jgi:phosphoenolpyruvate carboxykinase (ATP)